MLRTIHTPWWPQIPTLRIRSTNRIGLDRELARPFKRLRGGGGRARPR